MAVTWYVACGNGKQYQKKGRYDRREKGRRKWEERRPTMKEERTPLHGRKEGRKEGQQDKRKRMITRKVSKGGRSKDGRSKRK